MHFKTIIAPALILIFGGYTFAQSQNYTAVVENKSIVRAAEKDSKYVVTIEEAAKMRLDAAKDIPPDWKKIQWKEAGISLAVPEEFEFVAHRDDRKTDDWQARRWQSRLPQPNDLGYKVWISIADYETRGKKSTAELLKEEEEFLNTTDGSDVSDLPPITRLKLNGVDGVTSRWEIPQNVKFYWVAFRIYKGKLQKIRLEVSGREEVLTGMRQILQSVKIAQD